MKSTFHYIIAHTVLPRMTLSDPSGFLEVMAAHDVDHFMEHLATRVAADYEIEKTFDSSEINVHLNKVNHYRSAIVELAEPQAVAEAFFVALVLIPTETDPEKARYFTLEKGVHMDGTPRTVLGEWVEKGREHSNLGDGPEPTVEGFASSLASLFS